MIRLRPAQVSDADFAGPLIQEANGDIGLALTGTRSAADAAQVIGLFFRERGNRLSFTQAVIAEEQQGIRPLGLALLYPGEWASALDEPLREHLRSRGLAADFPSEGRPGELYLDTLAVVPAARGRGVGAALLQEALRRARSQSLTLALLAEEHNPATRLYARCGLRPTALEEVAGHRYWRFHGSPGAAYTPPSD